MKGLTTAVATAVYFAALQQQVSAGVMHLEMSEQDGALESAGPPIHTGAASDDAVAKGDDLPRLSFVSSPAAFRIGHAGAGKVSHIPSAHGDADDDEKSEDWNAERIAAFVLSHSHTEPVAVQSDEASELDFKLGEAEAFDAELAWLSSALSGEDEFSHQIFPDEKWSWGTSGSDRKHCKYRNRLSPGMGRPAHALVNENDHDLPSVSEFLFGWMNRVRTLLGMPNVVNEDQLDAELPHIWTKPTHPPVIAPEQDDHRFDIWYPGPLPEESHSPSHVWYIMSGPAHQDSFADRLQKAVDSLNPMEASAIAFVFGMGLGALLRVIFVLVFLFVRHRRGGKASARCGRRQHGRRRSSIRLPCEAEIAAVLPPYTPTVDEKAEFMTPAGEKKPVAQQPKYKFDKERFRAYCIVSGSYVDLDVEEDWNELVYEIDSADHGHPALPDSGEVAVYWKCVDGRQFAHPISIFQKKAQAKLDEFWQDAIRKAVSPA